MMHGSAVLFVYMNIQAAMSRFGSLKLMKWLANSLWLGSAWSFNQVSLKVFLSLRSQLLCSLVDGWHGLKKRKGGHTKNDVCHIAQGDSADRSS